MLFIGRAVAIMVATLLTFTATSKIHAQSTGIAVTELKRLVRVDAVASNTEGDFYVPPNRDPIVSEALGHFNEAAQAAGSASPGAVSTSSSQDSLVQVTETNLVASGTLEVQASGTGGGDDKRGGWAGADPTASLELTFTISQPMGAILEANTADSATDPRQNPDLEQFQKFVTFSGTGTPPLQVQVGNWKLQGGASQDPNSAQTALRLETSPDSGSGVFHFNVNLEENRTMGIDLPDGPFSYDRKATFKLTVQPQIGLPEFTSFTVTAPAPPRASSTWNFTASLPSDLLGLAVEVEVSPTGEEGSWSRRHDAT
jgi:hypothetical protein